jgi:hypothetical protein
VAYIAFMQKVQAIAVQLSAEMVNNRARERPAVGQDLTRAETWHDLRRKEESERGRGSVERISLRLQDLQIGLCAVG